jgi:anti-anti-sigma regulatory factor/PAS domain-containing protein
MSKPDGDAAAPAVLAHLATLIELLPKPCALLDASGMLSAVNAAWRDVFFHTGLGMPLTEAVAALFHWQPHAWQAVAAELAQLLAGELDRVNFDAELAEPPERWVSATLALSPHGQIIWQLSDVTRWQIAESEASQQLSQVRDALESISDGFALYDHDDRMIFCNQRYRAIFPLCADIMQPGRSFSDILRIGAQRGQFVLNADEAIESFVTQRLASFRAGGEHIYQLNDERWVRAIDQPTRAAGVVGIRTDITEQRRLEALSRERTTQAALIAAQAALLSELSTPLLRISAETLVLPLIGALDSQRAARVIESLLNAIGAQRTNLVILDITGVPLVDTQVANLLIQCARAVHLLGTRLVLTGIRPDVAETMITLGIDLGGIVTRANLQDGVREALRRT